MARLTDREIDEIARRIAADIVRGVTPIPAAGASTPVAPLQTEQGLGLFATVGEAVRAAAVAQTQFAALKLEHRARIIGAMRQTMLDNADALARAALSETGYGRHEDKILKNRLVTEKT